MSWRKCDRCGAWTDTTLSGNVCTICFNVVRGIDAPGGSTFLEKKQPDKEETPLEIGE